MRSRRVKHTSSFHLLGRCIVVSLVKFVWHGFTFQLTAATFLFRFFHSVFCFRSPKHAASMKIAACALLVAGVASASVSSSSEKSSVKELSHVKDATVGEVAAALKLLARERPHQSFLQNDLLEEALWFKN